MRKPLYGELYIQARNFFLLISDVFILKDGFYVLYRTFLFVNV